MLHRQKSRRFGEDKRGRSRESERKIKKRARKRIKRQLYVLAIILNEVHLKELMICSSRYAN